MNSVNCDTSHFYFQIDKELKWFLYSFHVENLLQARNKCEECEYVRFMLSLVGNGVFYVHKQRI